MSDWWHEKQDMFPIRDKKRGNPAGDSEKSPKRQKGQNEMPLKVRREKKRLLRMEECRVKNLFITLLPKKFGR